VQLEGGASWWGTAVRATIGLSSGYRLLFVTGRFGRAMHTMPRCKARTCVECGMKGVDGRTKERLQHIKRIERDHSLSPPAPTRLGSVAAVQSKPSRVQLPMLSVHVASNLSSELRGPLPFSYRAIGTSNGQLQTISGVWST